MSRRILPEQRKLLLSGKTRREATIIASFQGDLRVLEIYPVGCHQTQSNLRAVRNPDA